MNASDGCRFATTSRFHAASPASIQPARRPTRGSGLGGVVDMSMGALVVEADGVDIDAQPPRAIARPAAATARASLGNEVLVMIGSGR
jgi:hypothetical protein